MDFARGNLIDNQWILPDTGASIRSINPATADEVVLEAPTDPTHAGLAAAAAARAWPAWAALTSDERIAALRRFARELAPRIESLARAMSMEMGKTLREARIEANSLLARIDLVAEQQLPLVKPWTAPGVAGECRYHPLGVIAVLGPYNFPLHLCHAHIIPALATGNTVVVKPSERTPLSFQRYMEAWLEAGLPPVLHMVQGGADVGRALLAAPELRGVALTGSWQTGHAIQKALLDRPEVLPALEMGGQNMAIVLEDADLDQALEGVLLGAFLTTGQRCTCTSRLLIQKSIAKPFIDRLIRAAESLTFGDPSSDVFMGPMASVADRDRLETLCAAGRTAGAEVLLAGALRPNGAWRGPSIHLIAADHDSAYTREEVFGPDLAVTIVDDLDHAIAITNQSAYGLSIAIFSARRAAFETVYLKTRVGCVNWNRSTNRAVGALPFGGVGKSGNYRAAGSDAVRYTTFPVQVQWNEPGILENDAFVREAIATADPLLALEAAHRIEEALEPYGIYPEIDTSGKAGVVALPLIDVDGERPAGTLSRPLADALKARGFTLERSDSALKVMLPPGERPARELARALSEILYDLRRFAPQRFLGRRPAGSHVPAGDALSLPRSEAFMRRLIAADFIPDDKKPPVIDLFRSAGPYLASVDRDPLVVFDAASQIATHAAGLNPPAVLEAITLGQFGTTPIDGGAAKTATGESALTELAATLRHAAPDHPFVAFANSGAEANELALAAAAALRPGRRAVVAFRGAFHGRTMLAIHSTWNPAKRLRFELEGSATRWVDLPVCETPHAPAPEPQNWLDLWRVPPAERRLPDPADDRVLEDELRSLLAVEAALADDQVAAVIAEPMQAEGGERYSTPRFFRALRALTAAYKVPLIIDEVQCGFYLGGPFFWHTRFNLPSPPDVITVAKKAQVGVALSRTPLPASADTQPASALRGLLYAELLADAEPYRDTLMNHAQVHLDALQAAFPALVLAPRLTGWSFGFDLPTANALNFLVNQRLWRGYMIYGAGDRGLRFRFHPEITLPQVDALFQRLIASLDDLSHERPSAWRPNATAELADLAPTWPPTPPKLALSYRIQRVTASEWPALRDAYEALQIAVYEPARQDDFRKFTALIHDPGTICIAVYHNTPKTGAPSTAGTLVAASFAFPLEHVADLDGPAQDPTLGRGETLYAADLTVHHDHRAQGLGRALKEAQVVAAMQARRADGSPRYAFLTGRNRCGATDAMARLNAEFGAWLVARHHGQYGDPHAAADYYRIPLTTPRLPPSALPPISTRPALLDLAGGLERRLGDPREDRPGTDELRELLAEGRLTGALANKLSLCNFVTPGLVRAHEWLRLQAPKGMGHLILASGQAETLDKTLRSLKYHRGEGRVVVSIGPVRAGLSTAAARSATLPADDPRNWFGWPTTADPTRDPERALADLKKVVTDHSADKVLAVLIEPVYRATGRAVPDAFWASLRALCDAYDLPLVVNETLSGGYRSGRGLWRADTLPVAVDALLFAPGGQLGLGFVTDRYYVAEKLTLISTWDGDELALTRLITELRVARQLPIAERARQLRDALGRDKDVLGEGLSLALAVPNAETVQARLLERGIQVGLTEERALSLLPALNLMPHEIVRFGAALTDVLAREVKA